MKPESVELALQILDGSRLGETSQNVVRVERAKFEMKGGAYDPKLKPKKLGKKELERRKKKQEKLLAWEPDKMRGERNKRDKVIGKNFLKSKGYIVVLSFYVLFINRTALGLKFLCLFRT